MPNPIPPTPSSEYLDISVVATKKYLDISRRQIARMCESGIFKTAFKPGTQGRTSKWKVQRAEVIAHKINGHAQPR